MVRSYDVLNGAWLAGTTITQADVAPEEAESWNVGLIWQSQGFASDHDLSIIVDYFDIHTMGEIGEISPHNFIATTVFSSADPCAHPLASRIEYNGGTCTGNPADMNRVTTEFGNGSDQMTNGFDYQINYMFPIGEADATFGLTGTSITELTTSARILDGFEVTPDDDRLGQLNFSSVGFSAPKHRINSYFNYNRGDHNVRLTGRYVSGLTDERGGINPVGYIPGTQTPVGQFDKGNEIDSTFTFDLTYVYDLNENLRLTANVQNLTDVDPPFVRAEFGFDPRMGVNALGRTIEVGFKYTY